jgi:transcriptional regulator with XRE-family HTH domain
MQTISFSPERLREAREQVGMSQAQAAREADVARATIQNAESGSFTPRADALARMARAYGVSLDSLFVHTGDRTESPKRREEAA